MMKIKIVVQEPVFDDPKEDPLAEADEFYIKLEMDQAVDDQQEYEPPD
jgi:hypothetical protein